MFDEKELVYLEEILNEGICSYLDSGYALTDDYVVTMRNILKKLNLKETYPFEEWWKENGYNECEPWWAKEKEKGDKDEKEN